MTRIDRSNTKSDRALALHEKGLETWQIAERLGCSVNQISSFIHNALKKRERRQAVEKAITEATMEVTRL